MSLQQTLLGALSAGVALNTGLLAWNVYNQRKVDKLSRAFDEERRRRLLIERFGLEPETAEMALWSAFLSLVVYYDDEERIRRVCRAFFAPRRIVRLVVRQLSRGPKYLLLELAKTSARSHNRHHHCGSLVFVAVRGTNQASDWLTNLGFVGLSLRSGATKYGVSVHKGWMSFASMIFDDINNAGLLPPRAPYRSKFKPDLEVFDEFKQSEDDTNNDDDNDDDDDSNNNKGSAETIANNSTNSTSQTTTSKRVRPIDSSAQLCFTGHSMGGAAACLLAVCFAERAHWPEALHVHTFGAPPVGGKGVSRLASLEEIHRYVRPGDVVPQRVPATGYIHVGYEVLLTPSRFARAHALSEGAQRRTNALGGVWSQASLLMALGVEPHSIVGYYRDVEQLYDAMQSWKPPPMFAKL